MKKQALLAVSALSLGVVGLATFTPVVSAVDSATATADVIVTVNDGLAIGSNDSATEKSLDVMIDSLGLNDSKSKDSTIYTLNNTANAGKLSVKGTTSSDMVGSGAAVDKSITANASAAAGTEGWSFKGGDITSATAMTTSDQTLDNSVNAAADGGKDSTTVTYTVGTGAATVAGTYTANVTYTLTAGN